MELLHLLFLTASLALLLPFLVAKLLSIAFPHDAGPPHSLSKSSPIVDERIVMEDIRSSRDRLTVPVSESVTKNVHEFLDEAPPVKVAEFEGLQVPAEEIVEITHRCHDLLEKLPECGLQEEPDVDKFPESVGFPDNLSEENIEDSASVKEILENRVGFESAANNQVVAESEEINRVEECEVKETNEEKQVRFDSDEDDWEGIERTDLEKAFAAAATFVLESSSGDNEDPLAMAGVGTDLQMELYGLHKIATEGPCRDPQQMYKSISARYVSAQRYSEALDILQSGACIQLKHGQITCGAELAILFVETLVKGKVPYDDETLDRVRKIYKTFPQIPLPQHLPDDDEMQQISEALGAAKTRVEGCSSFLKAAIKWSVESGAHKNGSPELHVMLAEYIYSESPEVDMARVSYHFVRGNNPKNFASILVNFTEKCYPGEDDLAIARATLMYVASGNLRDANYLMDEIKKEVASKQLDFPQSDLIQFIIYLLQTLQRDALPLFNMLRASYKTSLEREPTFNELLDEIAEKFYGVRRRNPLQGVFGDIFKLMGGE